MLLPLGAAKLAINFMLHCTVMQVVIKVLWHCVIPLVMARPVAVSVQVMLVAFHFAVTSQGIGDPIASFFIESSILCHIDSSQCLVQLTPARVGIARSAYVQLGASSSTHV